jgi:4-hydroxythreonine-4-phosphate dehydrogenase
MGDPAGVGPEVIVKALSDERLNQSARFLIVGDHGLFIRACELASRSVKVPPLNPASVTNFDDPLFRPDALNILDAVSVSRDLIWGKPSPEGGKAAAQAIEVATKMVLNGEADALVTAPISKQALQMAGVPYAGHTEFLAALCGVSETRLMLVCDELRVVHATGHMSLRDAIANLTTERIVRTVKLSLPVMRWLGYERPRITIAALNPHSGEGGMFGDEDERIVLPAVEELRNEGHEVVGPLPADSVFWRARNGEFDLVVALYHDQGHISR